MKKQKKCQITRFDIFLLFFFKNKLSPNKKREFSIKEIDNFSMFLYGQPKNKTIVISPLFNKYFNINN